MNNDALTKALQDAIDLHLAGDLVQAQTRYLEILNVCPEQADVLHNMGLLALQVKQPDVALSHLKHAVAIEPSCVRFWRSYLETLKQTGHDALAVQAAVEATGCLGFDPLADLESTRSTPDRLEALYQAEAYADCEPLAKQRLIASQESSDSWKWLGLSLLQQSRLDEAIGALQQAIDLAPEAPDTHAHLAAALHRAGDLIAAVAAYQKAIAINPTNPTYTTNLGVIQFSLGCYVDAENRFRDAMMGHPESVDLHVNLALTLQAQNKLGEAEYHFRKAIELQGDRAELHHYLSVVLKMQGQLNEAADACRRALTLHPGYADAHDMLGTIQFDQGQISAAESSFRQAVTWQSNNPKHANNLGTVLQLQRKLTEAEKYYRQALALAPGFVDALTNLGINLQSQGRIDEAEQCWRTSLTLNPDSITNQSGLLFHLNYSATRPSSRYVEECRRFGRMTANQATEPFSTWVCEPRPSRLKIGLVSGDFRNHPVGHFLHGLLKSAANTDIEFVAYPTHAGEDAFTARIKEYFADWRIIAGLNDAIAARLIHDDGIHVLIDLAGHSSHNRLPMFDWKPAPVQVSWLGYLASTGIQGIDYILSDPFAIRPEDEQHFTESIWRLPDSGICFTPTVENIAVEKLPSLETGEFTFGSFNNLSKMTEDVVALWSAILNAIPNARLLLKASQFNEPAIVARTLARYAAHGISSDRLLILNTVAEAKTHLATYNRVDVALDPFPYPGVTTSVEALWMGVPVLTLQGDGILARAGESININAGLADWIAIDKADYLEKAVKWAGQRAQLAELRRTLRDRLLISPLFDHRAFATNFRDAMWGMWTSRFNHQR